MAHLEVSTKDFEVLASILKDGPGRRRFLTCKELLNTLQNVGFSLELKGWMSYNSQMMFVFKPGDKGRTVVSYARQDDLKRQMLELFDWTKGTFVERPHL